VFDIVDPGGDPALVSAGAHRTVFGGGHPGADSTSRSYRVLCWYGCRLERGHQVARWRYEHAERCQRTRTASAQMPASGEEISSDGHRGELIPAVIGSSP
jgi:hypothetical protein